MYLTLQMLPDSFQIIVWGASYISSALTIFPLTFLFIMNGVELTSRYLRTMKTRAHVFYANNYYVDKNETCDYEIDE